MWFNSDRILNYQMHGIDIRTKGSGNIGSTNVNRVAGRKISIITQIVDISKGIIPVALGICLSKRFLNYNYQWILIFRLLL